MSYLVAADLTAFALSTANCASIRSAFSFMDILAKSSADTTGTSMIGGEPSVGGGLQPVVGWIATNSNDDDILPIDDANNAGSIMLVDDATTATGMGDGVDDIATFDSLVGGGDD